MMIFVQEESRIPIEHGPNALPSWLARFYPFGMQRSWTLPERMERYSLNSSI